MPSDPPHFERTRPASPTLVHLAGIPAKEGQVTVALRARLSIPTLRASPLSALSPML